MTLVKKENASNQMSYHKIEKEDNTQQTRYITLQGKEVDKSQRLILQSASGKDGRKIKRKAEICYSIKKKSTNLVALKLIA